MGISHINNLWPKAPTATRSLWHVCSVQHGSSSLHSVLNIESFAHGWARQQGCTGTVVYCNWTLCKGGRCHGPARARRETESSSRAVSSPFPAPHKEVNSRL